MANPAVSIIVPVYNVEKYIRRCLDSIVAQTFTDWECILVDDGTPDNSGKICDEYAANDSRFVVIHKENGGVSSARNAGLDVANGEWITFVDADDWIEPETYEVAYKTAIEKDVDLVQWNSWSVDENGNKKVFNDAGKLKEGFFRLEDCCTYFHGSMWNKIVSAKLFCSTPIRFDEDIVHCEDRIVAFKCYAKAKLCYQIADFFYNYFQRSDSALHSLTREKILQSANGIKLMENYISESQKNKLKRLFDSFKAGCSSETVFAIEPSDFILYRKLFPEVQRYLLFRPLKTTVIHWFLIFHLDNFALFIIKIWRKHKTHNSQVKD